MNTKELHRKLDTRSTALLMKMEVCGLLAYLKSTMISLVFCVLSTRLILSHNITRLWISLLYTDSSSPLIRPNTSGVVCKRIYGIIAMDRNAVVCDQ